MILADFVFKRRREMGFNTISFSRRTGRSITSVVKIESGRQMTVTTATAERFCEVLKCDMSLFRDNNWIKDRKSHAGKPLSEVFANDGGNEDAFLRENLALMSVEV